MAQTFMIICDLYSMKALERASRKLGTRPQMIVSLWKEKQRLNAIAVYCLIDLDLF